MRQNGLILALAILASSTLTSLAANAAPSPGQLKFFESRIRPVLADHCYKCHSAESGKTKGGLALDNRADVRKGGDSGLAVTPGQPDKSLLLNAISHADPDLEMPPNKAKLPEAVIADFRKWIEMGAPDPRSDGGSRNNAKTKAGRDFWAFKQPVRSASPETADAKWARRPLDNHILAKLEATGVQPSSDASPETLLRRLHFDLVGLPPSPDDNRRFLARIETAGIERALALEVDALLGSERFGERWGRHWLDVARYAESSGKDSNFTFPHAWRYRNYVIDAFNQDKPFDRFITEQIAGDLLSCSSPEERESLLIATGFLAIGPKGLNEMNPAQFRADLIDEQIDSVTRAITATSVACARCHDHKYDPITMKDYYGLAGIFGSSKTYFGTRVAPNNQRGGDLIALPRREGQVIPNKSMPKKKVDKLKADLAELNRDEKESKAAAIKARLEGRDPMKFFSLQKALRIIWRRGSIEGQLKTVDDDGRALPLAMGLTEAKKIQDAPLLERGEIKRPKARVPRGFPEVLAIPAGAKMTPIQSGRLELAQWLTDPDHPLTARVMANRIWRHLLGTGIVATMDNFGFNGERPSHPALLDHLALKFVEGGWSVKALVREIALSRTYRQSSDHRDDAFLKDPDNRLLWRASKRRMDAEAIRDAMLAVAGSIDFNRPSASLIGNLGHRPVSLLAFAKGVPSDLDGSDHRSVYLPVVRDRLPDALDLFDFAEPSLVTGDRETTNVPLQALYLMNGPFVRKQSERLARRVTADADATKERVKLAIALCFNRNPDKAEQDLAREFFATPAAKEEPTKAWQTYCQALLATAEFRNLD